MTPISDHKMVTFNINDTIGEHREFKNNIILEISKYNFNNRDHVKMRAALKETNWDQRHILDLCCVRLSNAAPFCKNYAKLYFDAKSLEK